MLSRDDIGDILRAEVERAVRRHRTAGKCLKIVTMDVPSGLPAPDGSLQIQQFAQEVKTASIELRRALTRFNGFVLNGIIPEDLAGEQTNKAAG